MFSVISNRIKIKYIVLYYITFMFQTETKIENKHENSHNNGWNRQVSPGSPQEGKEQPKVRCIICGSKIWRNNYLRHTKTRKHCDALYVMQDMFEVK